MNIPTPTLVLVLLILGLLGAATLVSRALKQHPDSGIDPIILERFASRLRGWWLLLSLVAAAMVLKTMVTVFIFGAMSFWAMREFITLTPTRPADHRTLFLIFFLVIPLQYLFVWFGTYEVYSIMIPVYVFLLLPVFTAVSGDTKRYLERIAKISFGVLICAYCLSYAPALMTLPMPSRVDATGAGLLCFLIFLTQLSEVFQSVLTQFWPIQHSIAPAINSSRTWEGLLVSVLGVTLVGALLTWATPFPMWYACLMSLIIAVMSFGGTLALSATKRDRGVSDYGTLIEGHGGIMDRIDTICFSAPIFFHLTRLWSLYQPPIT